MCLDGNIICDPDNDETGTKNSLSSYIWVVGDNGTMVFDAGGMDLKAMWLNALKPWVGVNRNSTKHNKLSHSISKSLRKSIHSLSGAIADSFSSSGAQGSSKISSASASASAAGGGSGGSVEDDAASTISTGTAKTSSKTFRSATKGMMKAFNLASSAAVGLVGSTTSSTTPNVSTTSSLSSAEKISPSGKAKTVKSVTLASSPTPVNTLQRSESTNSMESLASASIPSQSAQESSTPTPMGMTPTSASVSGSASVSFEPSLSERSHLSAFQARNTNELVEGIDALREPISQYRQQLEAAVLQTSDLQQSVNSTKQSLSSMGKAVMCSSAIRLLADEVFFFSPSLLKFSLSFVFCLFR